MAAVSFLSQCPKFPAYAGGRNKKAGDYRPGSDNHAESAGLKCIAIDRALSGRQFRIRKTKIE